MKKEILTKQEILERLHELFERVELDATLTAEQSEMLNYNCALIDYFVKLQECKDFSEVGRIGFGNDEEDEEETEDEEEEDE